VSWSKKRFHAFFATLLRGLRLLLTSVLGFVAPRMAPASCRIALALGVCSSLVVMLTCWPVGGRSAWAENAPAASTTYDVTVDRLVVESKEEGEPPEQVTVRSGNDPGYDLEFSAKVQGNNALPREVNAAQAQSTLSLLDEPLDLTLRSINADSHQKSKSQECSSDDIEGSDAGTKGANTTVFASLDGDKSIESLRFDAKVRPKLVGLGTTSSYIPGADEIPIDVCWEDPVEGQSKTIGPSEVKPFDVSFEVQYSSSEANFLDMWRYVFQSDIPYKWSSLSDKWSSLSGYLMVSSDKGQAGPGTLSLELHRSGPGYESFFDSISWTWSKNFFLAILVGLFLLPGALRLVRPDLFNVLMWLRSKQKFDIKTGWASNLTTVGAILGTVLAAGVLPEDTFFMSKSQYVSLNMAFGIVILVVTVVQSILSFGLTYLLSCAVTLAAGFGELIVVLLLLEEVALQGTMSQSTVQLLQRLLVFVSVLVTLAAFFNVAWSIYKKTMQPDEEQMVGLP
jgi:hypothetical protein